MPKRKDNINPVLAGLAAWALPGLGHWVLGQRARAAILFVTLTLTYWTGAAVGGVGFVADPTEANLWFLAELGMGPQVVALNLATSKIKRAGQPVVWPDAEIALIYAGVAGLLNLLVIFDAIGRAAGLPTTARTSTTGRSPPT